MEPQGAEAVPKRLLEGRRRPPRIDALVPRMLPRCIPLAGDGLGWLGAGPHGGDAFEREREALLPERRSKRLVGCLGGDRTRLESSPLGVRLAAPNRV